MRGKYSEQQKIATDKYVAENFDRIQIKVRKGKKDKISLLAEQNGMSMAAFIISLIEAEAERQGFDLSVPPTPSQIQKKQQENDK
ncbi:MAG: hypothetical protein K2J39_06470 [Ruminococcus sp.]|nr:hypothetical protein [Ruminococcus sp.]